MAFEKTSCAPSRSGRHDSCFDTAELEVIAHAWNDIAEKSSQITIPPISDINKRSYLHQALTARFANVCSNEACWLDNAELNKSLHALHPELYERIHSSILKPKATPGGHDWLSNLDIDNVMNQYGLVFQDFTYIGCFPSDHFKLNPTAFPTFVVHQVGRAAIIFNLDTTKQSGSHWVACFFDNSQGHLSIEYFDPTGRPPNRPIGEFLNSPDFASASIVENRFQHQKGNNECGVYSLYFVLERLMGASFADLSRKRIPDIKMNRFRKFLYRPFSKAFSMSKVLSKSHTPSTSRTPRSRPRARTAK